MKTTTNSYPLTAWLRPVDMLLLLYQVLLGLVVLFGDVPTDGMRWLWLHLSCSALLVGFCYAMRGKTKGLLYFIREWYPIMLVTFLYKEVGPMVHAFTPGSLDAWLVRADETIFLGGGPALWHWQIAHPPARWVNEYFHVGYGFYFLLMPIGGFALWFRSSREHFRTYMFALALTYYAHYLLFILLPAHSPRFFLPGLREPLPGYWFSDFLRVIVEGNAFPGGSFPSSHVAAVVQVFMAYKVLGKWRFPVLWVALTLFAGTVWGRYHYVSDLVAGLLAGWFFLKVAPYVEAWLGKCVGWLEEAREGVPCLKK